jgi:hypothetical protein
MAALARRWYKSEAACAGAAVVAGLNGFFTARVTFPNHFASAAWLPAVLYFQAAQSPAGLGVCLCLQWLAGFPPFSILSLLAAFALGCRQGRKGLANFLKGAAWFAALSVAGDPAIVAFYVGLPAIALALWGSGLGHRETQLALATGACFLLSLGAGLPGYRRIALLHIFRFPANWLLLSTAGVSILCAAGISRLASPRRQWLAAGAIALDLALFCQFTRVAWADPAFLSDVPPIARQADEAGGLVPVRIYHTKRLMDLWRKGTLETGEDYLLMRDYLAPSLGVAYGLQEASSYQTLLLSDAARYQARLSEEGPEHPLLNWSGANLMVDISAQAVKVERKFMRVWVNKNAEPRVFIANASADGSVKLLDYRPGQVRAQIDLNAPAAVVFAETDYPGWTAYLDGVKIPHGRFEGIFMAADVPAGRHELLFSFFSRSFALGLLISLSAAAALLGAALRSQKK